MSNAFLSLHGSRLCSRPPGPHQQLTTNPSTSSAGTQRAEAKLCPPSCRQKMEFSSTEILNCKRQLLLQCYHVIVEIFYCFIIFSLFLHHYRQLMTLN